MTSTMCNCTTRCSLKTAPGRAALPPGTRGQLWSQAHPALLPSSPPAVEGSGQPKWKVWVGKRCEMETKNKKDVQVTRTLVNVPSVWTGGCDQWPWAMDCETLVPSALGQPGFTEGPPGPPPCSQNLVQWSWDSPPYFLLFKRVKTKGKKVQKENLSENNTSFKE